MSGDVSDEMLMALADDELPAAEAAALMRRIAADPGLAARYAVFAETRTALARAFAPSPVPERLLRTVLETPIARAAEPPAAAEVVAFPPARRTGFRALWPVALAASLVLAAGLGGFMAGRGTGPGPVTGPVTGAEAALALAATPTGGGVALAGGGQARALGSFDTDLGLCRLIGLTDPAGGTRRLVACRADTGWQVALMVAEGDAGTFLPASDAAVEVIDGFLDRIGAGAPLDAAAEAGALGR